MNIQDILHNITREQLDRGKRVILYLIHKDPEIQYAIKRCVSRQGVRLNKGEPLTRTQLIDRIRGGVTPLQYGDKWVAFRAAEIYDEFCEYSKRDIRHMLEDTGLLIKEIKRKNPRTGKDARCFVIDIYAPTK